MDGGDCSCGCIKDCFASHYQSSRPPVFSRRIPYQTRSKSSQQKTSGSSSQFLSTSSLQRLTGTVMKKINSNMTRNKWHEPSILCPRELKGLLRAIQGVDSQRLDAQGRNFMHLVVTGATDDCAARLIPFLVMAGANINQKDENGQNGVTPLYCRRGQKHRLLGPRQFCCRRSIARLRCRPGAVRKERDGLDSLPSAAPTVWQ